MDITKEMMDNKLSGITIKKSWKTKPDGDSDEVTIVNGTFNFDGLTLRDVLTYAIKPLVINRQRVERTLESIPSNITIKVDKPGVRKPKEINVDDLSKEQAADLLAKLNKKLGR